MAITGFAKTRTDCGDVSLSVHRAGQGVPLVLRHGFPQNPDPRLIETDHSRIAADAVFDTGLVDFDLAHEHASRKPAGGGRRVDRVLGDRRQEPVFKGTGLDIAGIRAKLTTLPTPWSWSDLPDPFSLWGRRRTA